MAQGIKLTREAGKDMLEITKLITEKFTKANWLELGYALGFADEIEGHNRLLQSLNFNDDDYPGCVVQVIGQFVQEDPENLPALKAYISDLYGTPQVSAFVSTAHTQAPRKMVTFAPQVFSIPDKPQNEKLVSVMFPFSFPRTFEAIKATCAKLGLDCLKGDDIWVNSTFIQDIFDIIFTSRVVVADFSGKNPNVFYEVGIAHTLGKTVIPLAQHIDELPSDLKHHRAIIYANNGEGLARMTEALEMRLRELFPDVNPSGF